MNLKDAGWKVAVLTGAVIAALGMGGCASQAGTTITVTVTVCPTGKCAGGGSATKSLQASDVASLDASQMSATFSASGGITGDSSSVYTVTVKQGGGYVSSAQFPISRNGNTFTAANPSAVSNWIHSFAGVIDEVDVSVNGVEVGEIDGTNFVSVNANYGGASYGSSTTSWLHHNNY